MARLPYVIPEQASPEVRQTFAQLPTLLNVFKMMANAETTFRPLVRLGSAILAGQETELSERGVAGAAFEPVQQERDALRDKIAPDKRRAQLHVLVLDEFQN